MADRYAVIGNPIEQSKSPFIHQSFAHACGQDLEYLKILAPVDGFLATVDAFRKAGGLGVNVTAPFKLDGFSYATERSPAAEIAGAVNTLKFDGERVLADNFDGVGLVRDVVTNLSVPMRGSRILLLGAGGAARGALLPFLEQQPARLVIANRTRSKAHELARIAREHGSGATSIEGCGLGDPEAEAFDIVFNATSASMTGDIPVVADRVFDGARLAYELAYGKGMTRFLQQASARGVAQLVDGVGMLAEQAAEAFAWWRGVRPDTAGVIAALTVPLD